MHTEEPSPELLAWPLAPAIPVKKQPPTLPLGLMTKAPPPLYGPIEAKLPPPIRSIDLRGIPGKRPPPSLNAVVNRDGQSIAQNINANDWPPLAPEVELPPTIPPPKWRPSAKPGASDPKAHSQLMPLPKCGVVASDELLKCVTKMSLMSDDERKLMVEQLSPFSEESESEGC